MDGISVVIPTRGTSAHWPRLVQALARQQVSFAVEVLVVLNGPCLTRSLSAEGLKFPIQFLSSEIGVNRARQLGLARARYELVFFLDDDCIPEDELLLAKHFRFFQKRPALFALGGVYELDPGAGFFSRLYQDIQMHWLYRGLTVATGFGVARYLIGGHFSFRRSLAVQNKIDFDENIIYGGSELGFFLRACRSELQLELQEFSVRHCTQESLFSLTRKIRKQGAGQALTESTTSSEISAGRLHGMTGSQKLALAYFNTVFWYGYYEQKGQRTQFFLTLLKNLKNRFLFLKYRVLENIQEGSESKKERGDRF